MKNRPARCNRSGLLGALLSGDGKWMSRLRIGGKAIYLGYFYSAEESHLWYMRARKFFLGSER
jgi:hypothetical protein